MKKCALAAIVLLAIPVFAAHAEPQYRAILQVRGTRQGTFKAGGRSKSNRIPVLSFNITVDDTGRGASGQASGKRQHKPLNFVIEAVDAKEFERAAIGNEELTQFILQAGKPGADGRFELGETIKLEHAFATKVQLMEKSGAAGSATARVTVEYEKITLDYSNKGKKVGLDDWTQ